MSNFINRVFPGGQPFYFPKSREMATVAGKSRISSLANQVGVTHNDLAGSIFRLSLFENKVTLIPLNSFTSREAIRAANKIREFIEFENVKPITFFEQLEIDIDPSDDPRRDIAEALNNNFYNKSFSDIHVFVGDIDKNELAKVLESNEGGIAILLDRDQETGLNKLYIIRLKANILQDNT